jgi:hypothetical protein
MEALREHHPRDGGYETIGVVETLDAMGFQNLPLPLIDFWDLQHLVPRLHTTLSDLARHSKRGAKVTRARLLKELQHLHPVDGGYKQDQVLNALRLMGITGDPIPLADFLSEQLGRPPLRR